MADLSNELRRAWAETDRLRAFVRSIEWSSFRVLSWDGAGSAACPGCDGVKPGEPIFHDENEQFVGHRDDCPLVAALAPSQNEGNGTEEKP